MIPSQPNVIKIFYALLGTGKRLFRLDSVEAKWLRSNAYSSICPLSIMAITDKVELLNDEIFIKNYRNGSKSTTQVRSIFKSSDSVETASSFFNSVRFCLTTSSIFPAIPFFLSCFTCFKRRRRKASSS